MGIEPLNHYETSLVNTVDQALEIVVRLDSPACGVALDTFHMNIEEKDPAAAIRAARGRIAHVQVCGNDRGAPGGDHIDWTGTLTALVSPAPQETTTVFKGTLTAHSREQSYTRAIQAGRVIATLAFKGARSLTLTLIPQDPAGETVRAAGPSPLRLERVLPAGAVRFVVRGDPHRTTYTLTITNQPGS